MKIRFADNDHIETLKKLSSENLIIWIIGRSSEIGIRITMEEITIECWLINPQKHSMRGYNQFPDSFVVVKRIWI